MGFRRFKSSSIRRRLTREICGWTRRILARNRLIVKDRTVRGNRDGRTKRSLTHGRKERLSRVGGLHGQVRFIFLTTGVLHGDILPRTKRRCRLGLVSTPRLSGRRTRETLLKHVGPMACNSLLEHIGSLRGGVPITAHTQSTARRISIGQDNRLAPEGICIELVVFTASPLTRSLSDNPQGRAQKSFTINHVTAKMIPARPAMPAITPPMTTPVLTVAAGVPVAVALAETRPAAVTPV